MPKNATRKPAKKKSARKPAAKKAKPARKASKKAAPNTASSAKTYARRADFNKPGSVAIDAMPEPHRSIARAADRAIRAAVPGATSLVKWGNVCYYLDERAFAALMATKAGINLLMPGTLLADPQKLLQGTGQTMRHVKLSDTTLVKTDAVRDLLVGASKVGIDRM